VAPEGPSGRRLGPIADFRFAPEFSLTPMVYPAFPLELSVGLEVSWFRASVAVRVYPGLALTPRLGFAVPVLEHLGVVLELGVPVLIDTVEANPLKALGISASGGLEVSPLPWLGVFAMVGGRYYLIRPANDAAALLATAGLRVRLP
jgi:hypothetical protein